MLLAIRAYQRVLSPAMPPACRFEPTCSRYAYEAIELHGALVGLRLAAHRLWRCRPGMAGGYDPVPSRTAGRTADRTVGEGRGRTSEIVTPTAPVGQAVPTAERTVAR